MKPSNDTTVAVTSVAGAVAVILVWMLSLVHVDMPPVVASAVTVVVSALAGYLSPARRGHGEAPDPPEARG
ncbi:hypothetical protein [Amycolatopsis anabasis]|uniref:hypothetical protein n=1 Tax=Amycolatopsis anabasis TaxID=1840409 RepID=UPI00131B47D3|nr:hypothetical protein [Amycolatopsis anabasis]